MNESMIIRKILIDKHINISLHLAPISTRVLVAHSWSAKSDDKTTRNVIIVSDKHAYLRNTFRVLNLLNLLEGRNLPS